MQTASGPSTCRRPPGHPHADDLRAIHMQTTSGPSTCRRPPGHPHADDLRAIHMQTTSGPDDLIKTDISETRMFHSDFAEYITSIFKGCWRKKRRRSTLEFHNKGTAPYVLGSAPYVASKHVAVTIGTVAVGKTVGAAVIVVTGVASTRVRGSRTP